jgi:hypothetical protein
MSNAAGTEELLVRFVAEALSPLADRLQAGQAAQLIEEVGLRLPDSLIGDGGVVGALTTGAGEAKELINRLPGLIAAISNASSDDLASIVALATQAAAVVEKIVSTTQALAQVRGALNAALAGLTPAEQASIMSVLPELPRRLLDYMILSHLQSKLPRAVSLLSLIGVPFRSGRCCWLSIDACRNCIEDV